MGNHTKSVYPFGTRLMYRIKNRILHISADEQKLFQQDSDAHSTI